MSLYTEWGRGKTWRFAQDRVRQMFKDLFAGKLDALLVGSYPTNYLEVEADGTIVMRGSSTVWDDIAGNLAANKLESVAGALQYNYAENTITMNTGGDITDTADRMMFNVQLPHGVKENSTLDLHLHWEQPDAVARQFTVQYRIQINGEAKTTAWATEVIDTSAVLNVFPYVLGTINQVTDLVHIDLTDAGLSAVLQFRIARTDVVAGDIEVTFMDCHVEKDTIGSRLEYSK